MEYSYRGYKITHEGSRYRVTGPDGTSWETDTYTKAKQDIDDEFENNEE